MIVQLATCQHDDDLAQASIFYVKHRRELDPGYTLVDTLTTLYGYLTKGTLKKVLNAKGEMVAMVAYFYGTPEHDFNNRELLFVDNVILLRSQRSTFIFLRGLQLLVDQTIAENPSIERVQFVALSANTYLERLYGKFAKQVLTFEDESGVHKHLYEVEINQLKQFLVRFGS